MTIDNAWRWIDEAITAGVSAKMANWCADDDEGEQLQRAEAARDRARRALLALLDKTRDEALEHCIDLCRVHATDNGTAQKIANDINGWRIAARKGGANGR
jgi:hypothetical protein